MHEIPRPDFDVHNIIAQKRGTRPTNASAPQQRMQQSTYEYMYHISYVYNPIAAARTACILQQPPAACDTVDIVH